MRAAVGCDVQTGRADCGSKSRLLRAACKDLEREGREGCGAQTGRVNFEKNIILRKRVARWRADWVRPETPLERPSDRRAKRVCR